MTSKKYSDDLDLSLTGSQISALSSSRRPSSALGGKRPCSASGAREKTSASLANGLGSSGSSLSGGAKKKHARGSSFNAPLSQRSDDKSSTEKTPRKLKPRLSSGDEFLALFENAQPKIKQASSKAVKPTGAIKAVHNDLLPKNSPLPVSARSTSTVNSQLTDRSETNSRRPHSIFHPVSARSSMTVDSDAVPEVTHRTDHTADEWFRRSGGSVVTRQSVESTRKPQALELESVVTADEVDEQTADSARLNSQRPKSPPKSLNLNANSIANNMKSPPMTSVAKTSFSDMENSFQNIKHKTPVNQVKRSPSTPVGRNIAEDYIKTVNMSATKIQRWYRRQCSRRKRGSSVEVSRAGEAAMKRLLQQKKQQREEQKDREQKELAAKERAEEEQKKRREERARQARQQAIQLFPFILDLFCFRDEFLALFENAQPKIKQASSKAVKPTGAIKAVHNDLLPKNSPLPVSARSTSTVNSQLTDRSETNSRRPHSIFHPVSARSSMTVDSDAVPEVTHRTDHTADEWFRRSGGSVVTRPSVESTRKSQALELESVVTAVEVDEQTADSARLNSQRPKSPPKSLNLNANSIANNMKSPPMTSVAKTSFSDMENSFQNIKHKTPVNQVKRSPSTPVGRNIAEDYIKTVNMSATKIQRWYRRQCSRRKRGSSVEVSRAGEAAMKRLLQQKKQQREEQKDREQKELAAKERAEEEQKKRREERARQARQQAIQELQKKREEKRLENKQIVEEELANLEASGKVGKNSRSNVKKRPARSKKSDNKTAEDSDSDPPLKTPESFNRKVEEIFQDNGPLNNEVESQPTDRTEVTREEAEGGEVQGATARTVSQAATKTTLDDLLETLKELEAEDKFPSPKNEKKAWAESNEKHSGGSEDESYLTSDKLEKLNARDNVKKSGTMTEDKLRSILSFLDDVDTAERLSEIDHINQEDVNRHTAEVFELPPMLVPSADEIVQMEHASAAAAEVTNTVLAQKLELEEKKRTVAMLQKALNQQRELTVRHAKETEKEMKKRLFVQKEEYEEAIKRHLSFIDQLIDDKKVLGERCEQLDKDVKTMVKKYTDKIKSLEENHQIEMDKVKEMTSAAEKIRREKWIDEKTKKIKEMTVKGLEPEIQRLIAKHKQEMKKLKQIHEAELLNADERAGGRYVRMNEELREQLEREKDMACQRERELARDRYEKQLQQEEEAYQQQRRRLYQEIAEEKERIAQQAARQRTEMDKLQRQLEESHQNAVEAMRSEYDTAREEQERRHEAEIRDMKEKVKLEKDAWEENYKKKQETWLIQKERELKEQVRRERDKEIELVIQRLEEDASSSREECERAAENRIKRIRDKYEGEIQELDRSERQAMEKYNEMKARLTEYEGENERFKVQLRQKDREIADAKKLYEKLSSERGQVTDIVRQEFADRIVATEEECKRLKQEMAEMKSRHRIELEKSKEEIEQIHKAKDEEMEEVHKRVKQAIAKKEETVNQLRQQYQAAVKRADHLEGLLEQQRKQLLGKK
ncbi:centrosomal protein of 131 kDa-like [Lingula anatina]|uniref:Centrosomal protein of 131 kDa-like n=2 Tax=Lingula anatina TaxID=7574 RepID=A0A1S3HIV1_LINAN|nr:centrosomal protein of 131 kDa-like [Lingula anatina]|eukprot:XP_013385942.1 centrosomal protein of 131 kDa-like [Lingula anatina]